MPSPWARALPENDLAIARRRLAEERQSRCASPEDIAFWRYEVMRLAGREMRHDPIAAEAKVYEGYHGKHCYDGDLLICGWPDLHARHSREERRKK